MKEVDLPENLREPLETLLANADDDSRITELRVDGRAYIVKIQERWRFPRLAMGARRARAVLVSWLCRLLFGQRPQADQLLRNDVWFEGRRLKFLHGRGVRVPEVFYHTEQVLVMQEIGRVFPEHIRETEPGDRLPWLDRATRALADFHRRGFWHGGAQLRNITWFQDEVWRLDFEEAVGDGLALPVAQAYDFFQLLQSTMQSREFPEADRLAIGAWMLLLYLERNPDASVRASMADMANGFRRLRPLLKLLSFIPGRDLKALWRTSQVMQLVLLPAVRQADAEQLRRQSASIEAHSAKTMPELLRSVENA
jgi:tRNA A-37 threonylcarbamoyl transferase component Bud32